jgi:hypothetical protein
VDVSGAAPARTVNYCLVGSEVIFSFTEHAMAYEISQVIPDTNNIEIAKLAAALYLVGPPTSHKNTDDSLIKFGRAYRYVCSIYDNNHLDPDKALKMLDQSDK